MNLTVRNYQNEEDYWRIREFLRRVMIKNQRRELSWHVARWDYWWWFCNPYLEKISPHKHIFLWEDEMRNIVAVLNPEGKGTAYLQIDPQLAPENLEQAMIELAEKHFAISDEQGRQNLWVFSEAKNQKRHEILIQRGYKLDKALGETETQHRRSLDEPLPEIPSVKGYIIRSLGDGLELLERCYASGLGFHNDDIQFARNNRDEPQWYQSLQLAPLYRRDLDLVAVAPDGSIASFCTIWFDDVSRTAYYEPVATVPAHQRKGLSKAVLTEGLHRLKHMGCKVAFVGGLADGPNALYFSVMGPEYNVSEPWKKVF